MMACKAILPMEETMTNHSEIHKVEVQQEEYMDKMKIQHKEALIEMVNIQEVVGRSNLCIPYPIRMVVNKS